MPLTAKKIAHIRANIAKMHAGREQQVILTLRTAGGGTTTLTVNAVWRVIADQDPTLIGANHDRFHLGNPEDIQAMFKTSDVSLSQMRSCIYAVLGADHTGVEPATKYILRSIEPMGIMPGSDRLFTRWTRQH